MGGLQNRESVVNTGEPIWRNWEKVIFRFSFIFFLLMVIPIEWRWYKGLLPPSSLYDFLSAVTGGSRGGWINVESESGRWGFASYASWWLTGLVAVLGAAIWTILARNSTRPNYRKLYYWLRVIVRYRIALGLIAFGFIKFFPMQMPFPSLANLNTDFGDYAPFKLYWQIVGVSYRYEIFLGFLEILGGALLFFRSTTAIGAIINAGVLFNIAHANIAYDGGVHVYSGYFVLLSLFLLVQYIPDIWKLFIQGETVTPVYYEPAFKQRWGKVFHYGSKAVIIFLFIFAYGYYRYDRFYNEGRLKEPVIPGLSGAAGHYKVTQFVLDGDTIPYSPNDSVRWHEAFFERYSTFVYKVKQPKDINLGNGTPSLNEVLKTYEFTGRAGGKSYLYYEIDSASRALYLIDKNQKFSKKLRSLLDRKRDVGLKDLYGKAVGDSLHILKWNYERPGVDQILLQGTDENNHHFSVKLERINENYLTGKEWYMENTLFKYK